MICSHGIGHYLRVSEGPQSITNGYNQYEEPLADGMFLSDEPGFYKAGDFGIRIENDVEVIMAGKSTYDNTQFLKFDTITLLPYERSLIDVDLLTREQYNAINQYHTKVASILEPLLIDDESALRALRSRTANLDYQVTSTPARSKASMIMKSSFIMNFVLVFIITLFKTTSTRNRNIFFFKIKN